MNKNEFKIGDLVQIVELYHYNGKIGHTGTIVSCEEVSDETFYELNPYCAGRYWPAKCLELIDNKKPVDNLVIESNNDLSTKASEFLDRQHKKLLLL